MLTACPVFPAAVRQGGAAGVHQEAGGSGPGVGTLLPGRQPLHPAHVHRGGGGSARQQARTSPAFWRMPGQHPG